MEEMDKTIEVMKAAMEKENEMNDTNQESMDEQIESYLAEEETENRNIVEDTEDTVDDMKEEQVLEEVETADGKSKTGKAFFKNNKSKELALKEQMIDELNDRLMRNMAEFDNFRKRSDKEKSQMFDIGAKSVIEKLLPVVDNFERGLGAISEKEKESAFAQGIELIYKQLMTTLDEIGVKQIEAVGKEFDPNFHNAVMHGEDENFGENIISDEFQKGYLYRDIVVRHSMVKVVN